MKTRDALTILSCFTFTGLLLAASVDRHAGISGSNATAETAHAPVELIESQEQTIGPIRNLRFTLFNSGIRPSEMRIKAGLVNILVEDRTSLAQSVTIRRVLGTDRVAVGTIQKALDQSRGRNSFRLLSGEYELSDPNQPANKAVLLVEP